MTLQDFYDILDKELEAVIADNPKDERLYKGDISTRKSYALFIWFLNFYAKPIDYTLDITHEYKERSCTIIFSTVNRLEKKIIYVVESNWKSTEIFLNPIDLIDFKLSLDYFKLINSNKKEFKYKDKPFYECYNLVQRHLAMNYEIKFIYLSLGQTTPTLSNLIDHFDKQNGDIEFIDIERLKRDYIEVKYNKIQPQNLLK
jgi:hypothetical protein